MTSGAAALEEQRLRIAIFADGADVGTMLNRYREGFVHGFTTNPTLMAKAGIRDYVAFAREVLAVIRELPISFEVFSDEFAEMERQARRIASWGRNVNVKIPITNTRGEPSLGVIRALLAERVKLNVTAILTREQWLSVKALMRPADDVIISVFAGRLADTGVDPVPVMAQAVQDFRDLPGARVLWASPREVLNIYQADACGCHIITVTDDLLAKLQRLRGKDLVEFSLETVKMFHDDAQKAGFQL
ncbi:MAG TPA: transaldolase [Polyangiaceae bacterium]|jgi:transaldolase|nr:transaldolase [Polyangiaceae bacterium]